MLSLGYTKDEVIKITKLSPSIYHLSIENMKKKIDDIVSLGYTEDEVIKITKVFPIIYGLSKENIKQKIDDIVSLGYTEDEVIKITKGLPSIYGLSIENIKQKIEFYDSINMHELPLVDAKMLMQSTALSYARYIFYKERGIEVTIDNYRKLFVENKTFEKTYGITKKELLEKYSYEQYLEKQNSLGGLK